MVLMDIHKPLYVVDTRGLEFIAHLHEMLIRVESTAGQL